MKRAFLVLLITLAGNSILAAQSNVTKENVAGITNFARIESTVACAGAITPESVAEIKKMGYGSIINLRQASEQGANIDAEAAAAKSAGINFIHIPFNGAAPETAAVDRFIAAMKQRVNEPAFIHCAGGNRAAAMWFIKRAVVDKWDTDRAMAEAAALGFTSQPLKTFALDYIQKHK